MSELLINHLRTLGVALERVDIKESACTPPAALLLIDLSAAARQADVKGFGGILYNVQHLLC